MTKPSEQKNNQQKSSNFLATVFFLACVAVLGWGLQKRGISIEDFNAGNIILMSLATYRLTRILVFDKIFKLFRDFFRAHQRLYVFYVIKEIITCPWCAGVWASLIIVTTWFLMPFGQLLVVVLTIAGIASFVVILVNYVGLSTEEKQYLMREKTKDSDYTKIH